MHTMNGPRQIDGARRVLGYFRGAVTILHIADPANINRARCGLTLTRQAGELRGQWWWHDEGHHATREDVPPGVDEVAARDGLTVCAECRPANLGGEERSSR